MGVRGELYSNKVILPNRTYFFNVKENRMGDLYLNIVESKNRDSGGFDRQSVILFADDLQEFLKGFDESLKVLEKAAREKKNTGKSARKHDEDFPREEGSRGAHTEKRRSEYPRGQKDNRAEKRGRPGGARKERGNDFSRGRAEKPGGEFSRGQTERRGGERSRGGRTDKRGGDFNRGRESGNKNRRDSSGDGGRARDDRSRDRKRVVVRKRD